MALRLWPNDRWYVSTTYEQICRVNFPNHLVVPVGTNRNISAHQCRNERVCPPVPKSMCHSMHNIVYMDSALALHYEMFGQDGPVKVYLFMPFTGHGRSNLTRLFGPCSGRRWYGRKSPPHLGGMQGGSVRRARARLMTMIKIRRAMGE